MKDSGPRAVEAAGQGEEVFQWQPSTVPVPAGRPLVTIHYAQTLDGRIATRTGDSQWIGGEASLRLAHRLRASHDAVMVGIGTVLKDNPRLTVRYVAGSTPKRVIVDSTLRTPLESNVVADGAAPTLIATTSAAVVDQVAELRRRGVEVVALDSEAGGRVDLNELFACLANRGIKSVLIEGGRALITSALRHRLVDRYVVCVSAKLVGEGIEAVGDLGIHRLADAVTFEEVRFKQLGEDLIFDGRLSREPRRES